MRLILKIIVGVLIGLTVGTYAPEIGADWVVRTMTTIQSIVGQLISFAIPLIVFFFITSGISSLPTSAGKMLGKTVTLAYLSTILAASMAFFIAQPLLPEFLGQGLALSVEKQKLFPPFFVLEIPPIMNVMTGLLLSFLFGLCIPKFKLETIRKFTDEGKQAIEIFLGKVIVPMLPFYIAGEFARLAAEGQAKTILSSFLVVILIVMCTHFLWLSVLYTAAAIKTRRAPWKIFIHMIPAYFTALGTMSSAATIPVTLRQVKKAGVPDHVANFTVPLCANIHLCGSAITITTCSLALMYLTNHSIPSSYLLFLPFILVLGVITVAAPGAPGGSILAALGILQSMLFFSPEQCALIIAIYITQDSFGTACNVTGDAALSLLVSPREKKRT